MIYPGNGYCCVPHEAAECLSLLMCFGTAHVQLFNEMKERQDDSLINELL